MNPVRDAGAGDAFEILSDAASILDGSVVGVAVVWYDDAAGKWYTCADLDVLVELVEYHAESATDGYSLWLGANGGANYHGDGFGSRAEAEIEALGDGAVAS